MIRASKAAEANKLGAPSVTLASVSSISSKKSLVFNLVHIGYVSVGGLKLFRKTLGAITCICSDAYR